MIYTNPDRVLAAGPEDPVPGYFKQRIRRRGPWAPYKIWVEDGDRCPETGELLSDQIIRGAWAPRTNEDGWFPRNPYKDWPYVWPIEKDEFEWLMMLKTM